MKNKDYNLFNKKIFVTGASGFVGSHLVERLLECGAKVSVLVNPDEPMENIQSKKDKLDGVFIQDIKNGDAVAKILSDSLPDVVYHLAAICSVPYSKEYPVKTFGVNFNGTLNILESVRKNGKGRVVYISSAEIYDISSSPIDEDYGVFPDSPYAASKAAADYLAISYYKTYGTRVSILRPFNVYGPGNRKNVIFKFIRAALRNEDIIVEGGDQIRDFTYLDDFIEVLLLAGENMVDGEIFNIGSGESITIKELADKIVDMVRSQSKIIIGNKRDVESRDLVCDYGKIHKALGWKPQVGLEEGLKRTINLVELNLRDNQNGH